MGNCEYVRDYYGVPAQVGRAVIVSGRAGVIAEDRGNYIGVMFDDDPRCGIFNAHPTSEIEYGEIKRLRKPTRSQQRYWDFQAADWFPGTFREWLALRANKGPLHP